MELRDALCQITEIRQQMARSEVFRGYRSLTVGLSGVLAVMAAVLQGSITPVPTQQLERYLGLWIGVAAISLGVASGEMWWRSRSNPSAVARQLTRLAMEQFAPCLLVGAVLTLCLYRTAPEFAWALPGLWGLTFSLGVFASHRLLPKQVYAVALYYVLTGSISLLWGRGSQALAPWCMGMTFGGGQLLTAAILYWTLERSAVAETEPTDAT